MISTFAALLFAHAIADFVLQSRAMVERKQEIPVLALHAAIVIVIAQIALGRLDTWLPLAIGASHFGIDLVKSRLPASLGAFLVDQAAHIAILCLVAAVHPALFATGLWPPEVATAMTLVAGALLATRAGGFAVAQLMARFETPALETLPGGGLWIGLLERAMIFLFILVGEPAGIGFLIAAKSILRFDTVSGDARAAEYVIIGTLASFGWAMMVAWGTLGLLNVLPPLGFAAISP